MEEFDYEEAIKVCEREIASIERCIIDLEQSGAYKTARLLRKEELPRAQKIS